MKNIKLYICICFFITSGAYPLVAQELETDSTIERFSAQKSVLFAKQVKNPVFEFSWKKDAPILLGGAAMTMGGFALKAQVDPLTDADLALLDASDINAFDRAATRQYRTSDTHLSDYLLAVGLVSPFATLASESVRRDFVPVMVMYVETGFLAGGLTNISKGLFKRKRPFVYNPEANHNDKKKISSRHSFFSGHTANAAAFTFLTAYMVDRYAERPVWKWIAWSGAVLVPASVGYWRYSSGKHFPTDILTGFIVGAGTGILIPTLHKAQLPKDVTLNVYPTPYGVHLTLDF